MSVSKTGISTRTLLALVTVTGAFFTVGDLKATTPITMMPLGDSITLGMDYQTNAGGGYRDPLFRDLTAAGISFTFLGATTGNATPALTNAGQSSHNGYGSWRIKDLDNNLNGSAPPQYGGDYNQGGYFLTGGHGTGRLAVSPNLVLLYIGGNDLLQENPNLNSDLYTLVTDIHALSPQTIILLAAVAPFHSSGLTAATNAYNSYVKNQLVPSLSYTRFVDQNSGFLNADGSVNGDLLGTDNIHPNRYGYPVLAQRWAAAIEAVEGVTPGGNALTVHGGIGGGIYPAGSVMTIEANAPAVGSQFGNWMSATTSVSNPYSSLMNYTMPSAVTSLTANFAAIGSVLVPDGTYQILSPYDGLAIGAVSATSGASVQQQTYTGAAAQQWVLTNLGSNNVSLTLPGTSLALEVPPSSMGTTNGPLDLANYSGETEQQWQISLNKGNMQLANVNSGQAITINGYSTSAGSSLLQYTASGYTDQMWNLFPIEGTATQYPLVVNGGSGGGMYTAGTTVPITANTPMSGYQFAGWTGGISNPANPSGASTTLIAPGVADTITATYVPVANASVTVTNGSGSGNYAVGTTISVVANAPASGSPFAGWTGSTSALANPSAASTIFTVPSGGGAITATYTATATGGGSGTSLGTFSMLSESATSGNSVVVNYGRSTEGNGLTTYWPGTPIINVVSMGNAQYELVETLGGRCFTTTGASVTINSCTGSTGQLWTLPKQTDGSYVVQSLGQNACLSTAGSFASITAAACNASTGQRWQFTGSTPLTLPGAPVPAPVITPAPTPTPVSSTSLGTFSMFSESATSGNSVVVNYGRSTEGNGLTTYWAGTPIINVVSMGNAQYELVETLGGRCFTTTGASVTINSCTGSTGQLWTLTKQTDGSYVVQSVGQNACLNTVGSFAAVAVAACNASTGQRWQFTGSTPLILPRAATATANGIVNSATVPAGYHLTFDDEFQQLSLSDVNGAGTHWYTHTVQCCLSDTSNPSTPTYMAGISDGAGKDPYSLISGGGLDIRLQKTNGAWYSGVIATVDSTGAGFSQKYGYFEMKAKLPNALGTWPAFWLLNTAHLNSGAAAGEIDVLEEYGQFPTYLNTTLHDWTSGTQVGHDQVGYDQVQIADTTAAYHVYGMLWTAATMTFSCDGVPYYSTPTPAIMNQAYYPIIDLGLGGGWLTSQTPQSSDMLIQYMRVYSN